MNTSRWIWGIGLLVLGSLLLYRGVTTGMGTVYVRVVEVAPKDSDKSWTVSKQVIPARRNEPDVVPSRSRTAGVWLAAFLTLAVYTFLWGDNPFFKIVQSVVVGVSAGYAVVLSFWTVIVPNLLEKLAPATMRGWSSPNIPASESPDWTYLAPLLLCVLLLWRLAPRGGWISRWPLAFFIGVTAGLKLVTHFKADFTNQIAKTMIPLIVMTDGKFNAAASVQNIVFVLGVLSSLTYFFFSAERRGIVKHVSRVGVCVLMITFGASFGYTVMGRITLLAARLQFLFDDWLWLIDPLNRR